MEAMQPEEADIGAVLRGLTAHFSVEITPREASTLPPLPDVLPTGRWRTGVSPRGAAGSRR